MTMFLIIAVAVLIFLVIFQIAKASEYVSVLKGEEKSRKQDNKINGFLMVVFLVLGLIGVWYCNEMYFGKTLMAHDAASVEGARVDSMLMLTVAVTGVVELVEEGGNGYLIDSKNLDLISEKLHILLQNESIYLQMSKNALSKSKFFSEVYFEKESFKILSN